MVEEHTVDTDDELPLEGVGQKLRRSRTERGLTIEQIAEQTRIAQRHLELIEKGDFAALPARTYAFGFTRTYAKVLGLDDKVLTDELRAELAGSDDSRPRYTPGFEPGDPAKVPPRGVIWASAIAAVIFLAGVYVFYARHFAPGADPAPLVTDAESVQANASNNVAAGSANASPASPDEASPAVADAPDQVTFTALEEGVWVSFYEAGGRRLEQKLMARGESFVVPAEARDPRVWTGRPDAFAITIGGQPVAKLAEEEITVRDVPITAQALRARSPSPSTAGPRPAQSAPAALAEVSG